MTLYQPGPANKLFITPRSRLTHSFSSHHFLTQIKQLKKQQQVHQQYVCVYVRVNNHSVAS